MITPNRTLPRVPVQPVVGRLLLIAFIVALLAIPPVSLASPESASSILVTKTPSVATVIAPGGLVTFTVVIENTSGDFSNVTLFSLVDNLYGNLLVGAVNPLISNGSLMYVDFGYRGGPNAVTLSGLRAEAQAFPVVPLVAGVIIGVTGGILMRRRRWA